jgi:cephalosporin hydroxylase
MPGHASRKYAEDHSFSQLPRRPVFWLFTRVVQKIPVLKRAAVDLFENIYYDSAKSTWDDMSWLGVPCQKYPTDLWIYQEIISAHKPDLIIETGTLYGGSALYLASLLDLVGHGSVISVDIQTRQDRPPHPRITYVTGSSVSPEVVQQLESLLEGSVTRMVILDSDHRKMHVDEELRIYSRYVTIGQYLIVEDSAVNGHPISARFGPGPFESLASFLRGRDDFKADKTKEKFFLSANHNGYLLRVK